MSKNSKNNKGFTLPELMVSMSIIGTIGVMSADKLDSLIPTARDTQRQANIRQVQTALEIYHLYNNKYPETGFCNKPTEKGWDILEKKLSNNSSSKEVYIPKFPDDPLDDNKYYFSYCSDGEIYKISYKLEATGDKVIEQGL
ncbi:prepilin-type N-terminal cleavage/methylation domain-containing protein [Patescibacteria group bacterium]|nr:prepilin-type N-terminal cleavage/methylation domain-containing protein [Patescibacteria group bacterium]